MLPLLLALATILALLAPCVLILWSVMAIPPPRFEWRGPFDSGPAEPCWTEEIVSDGRYRYARSQCVHDPLMELDTRARYDDWPIPKFQG